MFDLLTCVLAYLANEYVIRHHFVFPVIIPTILGTALAFFIGFNNNQSYDRWWEARKIWGALVNDSRTWARQLIQYTQATDSLPMALLHTIRKRMVFRHIAFLYALKENLRNADTHEYRQFVDQHESATVALQSNVPNALLNLQSEDLDQLYQQQATDGFRFIELNRMLVNFCDGMGKSERIKNTVFPTTYNYYTRAFVWIYLSLVSPW